MSMANDMRKSAKLATMALKGIVILGKFTLVIRLTFFCIQVVADMKQAAKKFHGKSAQ